MNAFFALFERKSSSPEPGWADREFPAIVAESPLHLWRPGDPIIGRGSRLLVGVATWSGYDMRLLDVLAESLRGGGASQPLVEVFNTAECLRRRDFKKYVPRNHPVFHTPLVGIWQDGELIWSGEGHEAREEVARRFHSGSAEIVAYVQDWIKARRAGRA
ncbi:MAG TPA: hypothetical protein VKA46_38900 [Gemmataceae bacterium]|nr:hypothetical protein [Gemmataceae bacterium]